jgi:hypothetical protein
MNKKHLPAGFPVFRILYVTTTLLNKMNRKTYSTGLTDKRWQVTQKMVNGKLRNVNYICLASISIIMFGFSSQHLRISTLSGRRADDLSGSTDLTASGDYPIDIASPVSKITPPCERYISKQLPQDIEFTIFAP